MKRIFYLMLTCAGVFLSASTPISAGEKPNIVFVLFDDLGWGQPQSYRSASALRTPNLDRLTIQGMRFTDAHSAAAVCTPTRYGLLTGRYPWRLGQFGVLTTYSKPIIPPSRITVASLLKQHGYATACVGKWHLGMNWVDGKPGRETEVPIGARINGGPNALGFDYFYGFTHARNIGTIIEQDRVVRHVKPIENQPLMIEKTIAWIDDRKPDEPFFLYFPMCPPHTPIVPSPSFAGKSGAQDLVRNDPKYGDWLYQGDAMLGQIMDALDRNGFAENTLLIATSDNGAEHRSYAPWRDSKRSIYEGGHRVPFVARWPGHIEPGTINHDIICLNDLMATVAEILEVKLPGNVGEDSVSILAALLGTSKPSTPEAIVQQSFRGDIAIRQGSWKLIFHRGGKRELFNLGLDPGETKNVVGNNEALREKLAAVMQSYIDRGRSTAGPVQKNEVALSLVEESRGKLGR